MVMPFAYTVLHDYRYLRFVTFCLYLENWQNLCLEIIEYHQTLVQSSVDGNTVLSKGTSLFLLRMFFAQRKRWELHIHSWKTYYDVKCNKRKINRKKIWKTLVINKIEMDDYKYEVILAPYVWKNAYI